MLLELAKDKTTISRQNNEIISSKQENESLKQHLAHYKIAAKVALDSPQLPPSLPPPSNQPLVLEPSVLHGSVAALAHFHSNNNHNGDFDVSGAHFETNEDGMLVLHPVIWPLKAIRMVMLVLGPVI